MRPLVNAVVARDGGVCWLCGLLGADSADHEPPRSQLVRLGVANPDDPGYLRAAHLICNKRRGTKPVTAELKADLRRRMLNDRARREVTASPSPRFVRARSFESSEQNGSTGPSRLSPKPSKKNTGIARHVILVCGPPGAGKSTFARAAGLPLFDRDDARWTTEAQFVAAARLHCNRPRAQAVIIRSGATTSARNRAVAAFQATEVRLFLAPIDELHHRVRARGRADAATSHSSIRAWFESFEPGTDYIEETS